LQSFENYVEEGKKKRTSRKEKEPIREGKQNMTKKRDI
jgi:hypothetical protein